ncbi:MAG TPA: hypothetical protein VGE74_08050 [Gemmata sp.]
MIPLPTLDALDEVTIPTPCTVPWDEMHGDHRTRFCDRCQQSVHDVSELTRAEALELIGAGGALPCLRLFKRPDGRVMTADCTTRRERAHKWLSRRSKWAAALFAMAFFAGCDRFPGATAGAPCRSQTPASFIEEAAQHVADGVATEANVK